jgi:hypothetical protein
MATWTTGSSHHRRGPAARLSIVLWYKARIRSIKIGKSGMGAGRKHQVGLRCEAEVAEMSAWMRARGVTVGGTSAPL